MLFSHRARPPHSKSDPFFVIPPRGGGGEANAIRRSRTVDLFCGAAIRCYRNNFNHPAHKADLSDVDRVVERIREYRPEVVIGGPPCQNFSPTGRRREGRNASLTEAFAEISVRSSPRVVVMENVPLARRSRAWRGA